MRSADDVRARIEHLREEYDRYDPPSSPVEDQHEVATLRAIEELEWVLEQRDAETTFTE